MQRSMIFAKSPKSMIIKIFMRFAKRPSVNARADLQSVCPNKQTTHGLQIRASKFKNILV